VKEDLRAIDRLLAGADEALLLLKHVKPQNLPEEREKAKGDPSYNPVFQYALPAADVDDLEARIIALTIDDSPIGMLFRKKRSELLQRISLIRARGNARRFTEASAALFGMPSSVLITSAHTVLRNRAACDLPVPEKELLSAEEAKEIFEEVLAKYGLHDWQVIIREHTIARTTVGGRKVTLRADATFAKPYIPALIAHEIETHVLTAENGDHQPYELFRRGFANYLDTQEGLAIVNQNRFLSPYHEKRFGPVRNILGAAYALEHSFADTRHYLHNDLGYDEAKALSKAIELKRGFSDTSEPGALTKGIVYFRGQRAIEQFIEQGGDLARLYIGKIALEDLEFLEGIPGLKAPVVLPSFLRPPTEEKKKMRKKK
jgi:uncharacterized protein (TIGR02421 family)